MTNIGEIDFKITKPLPPVKATHMELVDKAARFLKRTPKQNLNYGACSIVLKEMVCVGGSGEIPDVIGWSYGVSVLIECKTSRADFQVDKHKLFRRDPARGMGVYRYFLIPSHPVVSWELNPPMIKPEELPDQWGLMCYDKNGHITIAKWAVSFDLDACSVAEHPLLLSALRRKHGQ